MAYQLGIDTGGTYTDAALVDDQGAVTATAKSLTTRHDLTIGIEAVLAQLPGSAFEQVKLVCLSTTLTTNSVVEGKGAPVCALLVGYEPAQVVASGLIELLGAERVVTLEGGHDAMGEERAPLDETTALTAIESQRERVSAFAVSAVFGVRNPAHELRLRDLVSSVADRPVTCGHELASSLGAPRRAMTVALNAGMIPHVRHLIEAVEGILERRQVRAPLMMVKGDGSLIGARTALQRPVGTVLSGPAASVVGAAALSGTRNAIVADMGGTTTDIAVVSDGAPRLNSEGALIGDWQPMVEAVQVYSIGIGGDSEVRFSGGEGLKVGPRRVVPLSLLTQQHPQSISWLERQAQESPNARQNRIALRLQADPALLGQLSAAEQEVWARLGEGPVELENLVSRERPLARALGRLERKGLAIYSGFTPSDAAHVLGLSSHWCASGALLASRIWARQMRWVYGYGEWSEGDVLGPSREVLDAVITAISRRLIEAGLNEQGLSKSRGLAGLLTELVVQGGRDRGDVGLFRLRFADGRPLVAVGAPAATYYPAAAERLGVDLVMPRHAAVANAVGAVMGSVTQRVQVTVSQPVRGLFRVFAHGGPSDFENLDQAYACAEAEALEAARRRAVEAGAGAIETRIDRDENSVDHDIDGFLFFDARVTATASGRPGLREAAPMASDASVHSGV